MLICKWEKFNDIVESRINEIDISEFTHLLKQTNQIFLYKKIWKPDFSIGFFKKSLKQTDEYLDIQYENLDISYPNKKFSIVCHTSEEKEIGTTFLVFPFKETLFAIKENNNTYYKGYWKDKIKWLERFDDNQLWTEGDCILIKKSLWDKLTK